MSTAADTGPDFDALARRVMAEAGCVAIILYGSRASGRHRPNSDIDLVGLVRGSGEHRRALTHAGLPVDLSLHGTDGIPPPETARYFAGGRLLAGDHAAAEAFLDHCRRSEAAGPPPVGEAERRRLRIWAEKTATRIPAPGDPAAALYRRGWLAQQLYELYFRLRGRWDPKIDEGFASMRRDDPDLAALFDATQGLPPGAALLEAQRALIDRVFSAP